MNEEVNISQTPRNIWVRALIMVLMACIYQIAGTVLFFIATFQFLMVLLNEQPNERLLELGRNIGNYVRQIARFLTFATEETPFPFSEWPSAE